MLSKSLSEITRFTCPRAYSSALLSGNRPNERTVRRRRSLQLYVTIMTVIYVHAFIRLLSHMNHPVHNGEEEREREKISGIGLMSCDSILTLEACHQVMLSWFCVIINLALCYVTILLVTVGAIQPKVGASENAV